MDHFSDIIRTLYGAAADGEGWHRALTALERAFSGNSSAVVIADRLNSSLYQTSVDPMISAVYNSHYHRSDLWMQRFSRHAPGEVVTGQALASFEEFDPAYVEDVLMASDCRDGLSVKFSQHRSTNSALTIYRGLKASNFENEDIEKLRALAPHIQEAMRLHTAFSHLIEKSGFFERALNRSVEPLLILEPDRTVRWLNSSALECLRLSPSFKIKSGKFLVADPVLQHAFEGALLTCLTWGGATAVLEKKSSLRGMSVGHLVRMNDRLNDIGRSSFLERQDGDLVMLTIQREERSIDAVSRLLSTAYQLTDREAEICCLIAAGKSVQEISEETHRSVDTVRTQVRRSMEKMGIHRQSEIVRILTALSR